MVSAHSGGQTGLLTQGKGKEGNEITAEQRQCRWPLTDE